MEVQDSYKLEHEAFMSGHGGGSLLEVNYLLFLIPASIFFHRVISSSLKMNPFQEMGQRVSIGRFLLDFCTCVIPMLLSFTIAADYTFWLLIGIVFASLVVVVLFQMAYGKNLLTMSDQLQYSSLCGYKKPFINEYRSSMLISTFIAILAVDFTVFPRRFAKTETYGVSLMDVGVGAFLVAQALTSKQARGSSTSHSRIKLFLSTLKSVSPLLIIGFIRFLSVKATDYQEHVSEYGVHWNFFFTLSFVGILLAILDVPTQYNAIVGTIVILVYQFALSQGLSHYIIHEPRTSSLFSQNKEGFCSSIGYTALFLFSSQLGSSILAPKSNLSEWKIFTGKLWALDILLWILTWISRTFVEEFSRRMANLSYVLLLLSQNVMILASVLMVAMITRPVDNSIMVAVNQNGLLSFLLANICTGLVNLSMKTIYASPMVAMGTISVYLLFVTAISLLLYTHKIILKFW